MSTFFDNVTKVAFERFNENTIRLIAFEECADTGAFSIYDIIEITEQPNSVAWMAQVAAEYTEQSTTEVEYLVYENGNQHLAADVTDFGRVRVLKSKMRKVLEQI